MNIEIWKIGLKSSTGKVELEPNQTERKDTVVTANLNIMNCSHPNVTIQIFGFGASVASQLSIDPFMAEIFDDEIFEPKSFALIYAHNATRSKDRFFKIGRRQLNDTLLKSEKIIVKNDFSSFPQHEIEYNNPNAFVTQLEFQFNVSSISSIIFFSIYRLQTK